MSLRPGDPCLLRYRYLDGSVQAALPMRVVDDTAERTVAWLAPGTPIMYWATLDGADPRSLPLDRRFAGPLSTGPRTWRGSGVLHVMLPGRPYQVSHFWHPDGAFSLWYVNLETPFVRSGAVFDTVDLHLDLLIHADGRPEWKDEDEAAAAAGTGHLRVEDLAVARSAGETLLRDLDGWPDPIGDWRGFRPPTAWTVPTLPEDWAGEAGGEAVTTAADVRRARTVLETERRRLEGAGVPGELLLTGGSSIEGLVTKGDVDLHLRVPADAFDRAVATMHDLYAVVHAEIWQHGFATFERDGTPPVGVAVTTVGSQHDRRFVATWERLGADAAARAEYNAVKRAGGDVERAKSLLFDRLAG